MAAPTRKVFTHAFHNRDYRRALIHDWWYTLISPQYRKLKGDLRQQMANELAKAFNDYIVHGDGS